MKRTAKSALVFALTASMVLGSASVSDAKAKKPKLSSSKVTITVGQKKKITVKNAKPKKTTWSLTKSGKKYVTLSKKKKTSIYIKGKKAGKATLTAKIKVGKKTYKKTVKITVKKKTTVKTTPKPSTVPTNNPTQAPQSPAATPTPVVTPTPDASSTPTEEPTPTAEPTPELGKNDIAVKLSEDTENSHGVLDAEDGETGITYGKDGATFTALSANSGGGVLWNINPDGKAIETNRFEKVIFKVSVNKLALDSGTPVVLALTKDNKEEFWDRDVEGLVKYTNITEANTPVEVEMDLSETDYEAYCAMVKFNTWTQNDDYEGEEDVTFTVHSITLVGKADEDMPTPRPSVTPTAEPTPTAEATPTVEPTPTTEPEPVYDQEIDLSNEENIVTSKGTVAYDTDAKVLKATDVDWFGIKLPRTIANGETVKLRVTGNLGDANGFRTWLCKGVDIATSNQLKSTENDIATGDFTWEFEVTATDDSTFLEIKGISYGVNISNIEISKVELLGKDGPVPTPTPEVLVATGSSLKANASVELSADTCMGQGDAGEVTYNEDGSATYLAMKEASGGGVAWYLNADKSPVAISDIGTLTIKAKAEGQADTMADTPVCLVLYAEDGSYWSAPTVDLKGVNGSDWGMYDAVKATSTTLTFDLSKVTNQDQKVVAVCLKYNAWVPADQTFGGNDVNMTIESISYPVNAPALAYNNLDADADYVVTANGKELDVCGHDFAKEFDRTLDADELLNKWMTTTNEVNKKFGNIDVTIITPDAAAAETKTVVVEGTNTRADGTYTVTVGGEDGSYTVRATKTTGTTVTSHVFASDDVIVFETEFKGKNYITIINLDENKKAKDITLVSDGSEIVKVAKNADGTFNVIVDKADAEKKGLVIAKVVAE